jgi:hypothetical protein
MGKKYFYLEYKGIDLEGTNWLYLNQWKIFKYLNANGITNITMMPLIPYTWNSKEDI